MLQQRTVLGTDTAGAAGTVTCAGAVNMFAVRLAPTGCGILPSLRSSNCLACASSLLRVSALNFLSRSPSSLSGACRLRDVTLDPKRETTVSASLPDPTLKSVSKAVACRRATPASVFPIRFWRVRAAAVPPRSPPANPKRLPCRQTHSRAHAIVKGVSLGEE